MSSGELMDRLRRHYIKPGADLPGGIFLPEVGWNGGNPANPSAGGCDAIYVGFTSTSGRILVGHELKVSRSDWLRELNSPGKSDGWADECHEWWLVVSDPVIVKEGELPAGWGLMAPGKSVTRMNVVTKPERKPRTHIPSWTAVRSIMARQDTLRAQAIHNVRLKLQREGLDEIETKVRQRMDLKLADLEANGQLLDGARSRLRQLEEALGVRVQFKDGPAYYNQASLDELKQVGEVLRQVRTINRAVGALTGRVNEDALDRITTQASDLRKLLKEVQDGDEQRAHA